MALPKSNHEVASIGRCHRRLVAAGDFSLVEQCTCGAVHLTIGAVTLRLAQSAIGSLAITLEAASRALRDGASDDLELDQTVVLS